MKCENCGAEIPAGNMYCGKCGEEIHIVPVFDPEVETEIDETLHRIQDDLAEEITSFVSKTKKGRFRFLPGVIVLTVISVLLGIVALTYLYNSPDYQMNQGNRFVNSGDYVSAIKYYNKALNSGAPNQVELHLYLAKCYEELGYEGKYEEYLLKVVRDSQASEEDLLIAYTKLISFYSNDKNYNTINNLLKSCNNDKIISIFADFMVKAPKFSHEPGYYTEIIPLKITSDQSCTIYYTLDGTTPTTESKIFDGPIFLKDGNYQIQAICVNKHGVKSDISMGEYQIEF
ncbi:MAG: chitobiase/beta-hexosaminidase C-terminal domain-containing protein [Lachnospiraceae bacterium]|nr:chitobiase/beta-hexosaminidase C-terminal domain-containing protein [Lachnospiraceae bacterium]